MAQEKNHLESPALKSAWERYAEFDFNAKIGSRQRTVLRQAAIAISMFAVLMAVFTNTYSVNLSEFTGWGIFSTIGEAIRILLVVALIINFIIFALFVRSQKQDSSQDLRTAAEEIKKEIYLYRTVLQWHEECERWLSDRITRIQRHVAEGFGNELILKPYRGDIPPYYDPSDPNSDPGFTRLLPADYLRYRLENQLETYSRELTEPQKQRYYLQLGLFATAGISVLLAAIPGGNFSAWVAVTVFALVALMYWLEPREIDAKINSYNQLIAGLNIIRDWWFSLNKQEQTGVEFFKLVVATEKVIWSHYNKHASEMWQAIEELKGRKEDALDEVLLLSGTAALQEFEAEYDAQKDTESATVVIAESVTTIEPARVDDQEPDIIEGVVETVNGNAEPVKKALVKKETSLTVVGSRDAEETVGYHSKKRGLPHAFVVMPFGRKQGPDGRWIDFDSIYYDLIKPAVEAAGFESFRADQESVSGDILTDMFQELLLADMVIADLSIDNANVFYELGVRHAMRKRGLVHIQSGRPYLPFDIFNVRTIPYQIDKTGRPDPDHIEKDKQAITKITRETWASDVDRIHSPIFNLLDGLVEPDRKTLRTPLATGFWREYNEWRERVTISQRQKRIGDLLVLTEEIRNPLIREEAISEAGRAMRGLGRFELALQQYRHGLAINPRNIEFRREEAFHLNRMNRTDEAIVKLERLLQDHPLDIEAMSFLGRIYKQMWTETWEGIEDESIRMTEAFNALHWLVKATHTYLAGYRLDQNNHYPGINALSLAMLIDFLAKSNNLTDDPDVEAIRADLPKLKGAVQFALENRTEKDSSDYWALVSLAELQVSIADDPVKVSRTYKRALTAARKNVYNLQSALSQLRLLQSLGFRPEYVQAGVDAIKSELGRIHYEEEIEDPGRTLDTPQVFIFSGHPVDAPKRKESRFPAGMEKEARDKINKALDKFKADSNDLAVTCGAAAGGDIIFIEVCLERNMNVEVHLPFEEARYIQWSISYAGDNWIERFYNIRNNPNVKIWLQPDYLGRVKFDDNMYERNERWALYSSFIHGVDRMRLIVLWDGLIDDTPGGPDKMIDRVRQLGGITEHLNTTKFHYWKAEGKVSRALDLLTMES
ncbi:MAG: hypothetical protein KDJ65_04760 [Anaerolineae bacterium]|nr:hypothetical protein [Anaerolineae bacterium]